MTLCIIYRAKSSIITCTHLYILPVRNCSPAPRLLSRVILDLSSSLLIFVRPSLCGRPSADSSPFLPLLSGLTTILRLLSDHFKPAQMSDMILIGSMRICYKVNKMYPSPYIYTLHSARLPSWAKLFFHSNTNVSPHLDTNSVWYVSRPTQTISFSDTAHYDYSRTGKFRLLITQPFVSSSYSSGNIKRLGTVVSTHNLRFSTKPP